MKHGLIAVVFLSSVAVAGAASAQHTAGGAPSVGTAVPSGGGSSSDGGSSAGSGDGGAGAAPSISAHVAVAGHRPNVSANTSNGVFTNYSQLSAVPAYGRPRNGAPIIGTAIPRTSAPPPPEGGVSFIEGAYNPWLYGYEGLPFYGVYDPFAFDLETPIAFDTTASPAPEEKGVLHFNVRPRDAEVYVDDERMGKADEFEGLFHRLRLDAGVHRVELRAPGYQPVVVNVRIGAGESITYRGVLEKDAK